MNVNATKRLGTLLGLCLTILMARAGSVAAETADYVFKNGKVYTLDAKHPWAESVAVKGNKLAYVGPNGGSKGRTGPETKVVDLKGQMPLPGIIDGHNHFIAGAGGKRGLKLVGSKDTQEWSARYRSDLVQVTGLKEKDLFKVPPSEISPTKLKLTMMNGIITYRARRRVGNRRLTDSNAREWT